MIPNLNNIYQGDCIEVMKGWPDNFVDTIVTDPPYGLSFMGKSWDHGVPGIPFWAEMLRICKPGAMLLAFGGTRTFHRMTCAIEDAGWEIRDCLTWLYGSGFPKSLDISKAIDKANGKERISLGSIVRTGSKGNGNTVTQEGGDKSGISQITSPSTDLAKQWNGWGTALKPAWEPVILAMKPLDGTFAENADKWGVAGLNVDGGRIKSQNNPTALRRSYGFTPNTEKAANSEARGAMRDRSDPIKKSLPNPSDNLGRWPANLILDEEAAAMLDGQSGTLHAPYTSGQGFNFAAGIKGKPRAIAQSESFRDSGGASRFFYVAKADRAERNEGCDGLPQKPGGAYGEFTGDGRGRQTEHTPSGNGHPTVKPLDLMKYLVNLTKTPTGGIVLDPFAGSGTTLWAAESHNRPWIGIEMNADYVKIAQARIKRERDQLKMF